MFSIFDKYVGKLVLFTILVVAVVLIILTALITFVDQLRYIGRGDIDFSFLIVHVLLQVPEMLVMMFPISVLLGCVIALGSLAKNSELVVLQSFGISKQGIIMLAIKTIIPLIIVVALVSEFVVPPVQQYAASRYSAVANRGQLSITHQGLWLRENNYFFSIRFTMSDGSIQDISRYEFDKLELKSLCTAKAGIFNGKNWDMFDVVKNTFTDKQVHKEQVATEKWDLGLNPSRIETLSLNGLYLTIGGLLDYINYLEENNLDARTYRLELYNKLVMPFAIIIMLLLAASTVFGPLRSMTMGARVVMGIALGFLFYIANQIGAPLALVYGVPPLISACAPSILFLFLAIALLRRRA